MKRPIIDPNRSYSFRDYFEMNAPIDEILAYFGYSHQIESCNLPKVSIDFSYFAHLINQFETHLRYVNLSSEAVRREVLVAPIVLNLVSFLKMRLQVEYPLHVSAQLKGKIDYYLQRKGSLLIIEAKHDDMSRGFTQLSVELIALDQWLDEDSQPLYGIVTMGDAWRFGILDRLTKQITQDTRLYTVPTELETLLQILIAILEG